MFSGIIEVVHWLKIGHFFQRLAFIDKERYLYKAFEEENLRHVGK